MLNRVAARVLLGLGVLSSMSGAARAHQAAEAPSSAAVLLPGAQPGGVALDYIAIDRERGRVFVPAGGTGRLVVIDARTRAVRAVENLTVREVERQGTKRTIGPSAVSIGDGFVYIGNRADSSVCAIDTNGLTVAGCVTLPHSPDGVVYVPGTKEVWVTAPRDKTIHVLDVSTPGTPRLKGSISVAGEPEGYAVDLARGSFFTNLEDRDRTLRIDLASHKVVADWAAGCGADGPRGLAFDSEDQFLVVACTNRVEVLDAGKDGHVLSSLETGAGVDNLDYLPSRRWIYAAAGRAATITFAHLDTAGHLTKAASRPTAEGARNAVASDDGLAFVADGPHGRILVVDPAERSN